MKRLCDSAATSLFLALLLTSCSTDVIIPDKATYNGTISINAAEGSADLSVSALKDETVLLGGEISNPRATVNPVDGSSFTTAQAFTVDAEVCGDITARGDTLSAVLTLDASNSMEDNDPDELRAEAAKGFVDRMDSADRVAIASFDTETEPTSPYQAIRLWQDFTNDKNLARTAVDDATFFSGGTNLWDAGIDSLELLGTIQGENEAVVLLTDGEDRDSSSSVQDLIDSATQSGIAVYTIGLGNDINADALSRIATETRGTFNEVAEAADLTGLFDRVFNASQAAGCITLTFDPVPQVDVKGELTFEVNGATLSVDYSVPFLQQ